MLTEAYLGLGSNLGDRRGNIVSALKLLCRLAKDLKVSGLYETDPRGFEIQPRFLNAACRIRTGLDAFQLLAGIKEIERAVGRHRSFLNAPRTLDVDILVYGRLVLNSPGLVIPHPRMIERAFVLVPLAEIAPDLRHPTQAETVLSLLACRPDSARDVRMVTPADRLLRILNRRA